ncbi:MAG: hypothetical protein RIR97_1590 [Pseudomonadota bacterium]
MDFSLIETLRWEPDKGFVHLALHMARLEASAKALGFHGAENAEAALNGCVENEIRSGLISPQGRKLTETQTSHRVRLELVADGTITVTSSPLIVQSENTIWTVKIASTRLSSEDKLLHHKTSRRSVYDLARAEFSKDDADEVLLLNERGELCEGTITSVFVQDDSGMFLTPPLNSGLLAGVLRSSLLQSGKAREQKLTPGDLDGRLVYVGNSLRGLISARLKS